ncbi:MAG TPA: hypothetical protein VKU80_02065, partial [Planctomycetota bacterium]|nr:hypothetical protein [Planctomycetota bacterium]
EILGDAEKQYEEAKLAFKDAKTMDNAAERNARLKDALTKLKSARDAYSATRELFPEDRYSDLDQKLVLVMQLTRMLRGEVTHDGGFSSSDGVGGDRSTLVDTRPLSLDMGSAFATLADPAKRSNPELRVAARETFRTQRASYPTIYELATAAMIYLSRSDSEWKLQGGAQKALQEYFAKPWFTAPLKMTPADNQVAANYLVDQINTLRKADPAAPVDALTLFGIGHIGQAPIGQENDRTARLLGLVIQNGIAGTAEGHVVRELDSWITAGDFDLAVMAWIKEPQLRMVDTPVVRYVWTYALLRLVQQKQRGFDRAVAALGAIPASAPALREHLAALAKSIKAVAICNICGGEGKLRCTNCHGKKETRIVCRDCGGTGRKKQSSGILLDNCPRCKNTGIENLIKCEKCKDGFNDCKQCDKKQHAPPTLEEICTMTPCKDCDGRGYVFRRILWACRSCMGTGQKLAPRADPSKLLASDKP